MKQLGERSNPGRTCLGACIVWSLYFRDRVNSSHGDSDCHHCGCDSAAPIAYDHHSHHRTCGECVSSSGCTVVYCGPGTFRSGEFCHPCSSVSVPNGVCTGCSNASACAVATCDAGFAERNGTCAAAPCSSGSVPTPSGRRLAGSLRRKQLCGCVTLRWTREGSGASGSERSRSRVTLQCHHRWKNT